MGTVSTGIGGAGRFEPEVTRQFLPGCRKCKAPHPLALKIKPADLTKCHQCGEPVQDPGPELTEKAAFGFDPIMLFGRGVMAIGRFFNNLGRKV
jgi:hypothetical protein